MKVAWITRSFLDYRIPVFKSLDEKVGGGLHLFYSGDYVPDSVSVKAVELLQERAYPMRGEFMLGSEDRKYLANRNFSFRWQPGLLRRIALLSPDVLVCDGFFKWTLPAFIYKFRNGVPLIVNYERTRHTERDAQRLRVWYRRLALRYVDAVDCSGTQCKEYVASLGFPTTRITMGHMSADVEGLANACRETPISRVDDIRASLQVEGLMFLFVGQLVPRKGIKEFLSAWNAVEDNRDMATLVVIGDGDQRRELEDIVLAWGLKNVRFPGQVAYDDIGEFYAAADVFVMPTLEDNWSLVVPEAMACNLPIMTSVYNGLWPELVQEENGWVFDTLNPDSMKGAIRSVLKAKESLPAMGQASGCLIESYGPDNAADSILDACRIALGNA